MTDRSEEVQDIIDRMPTRWTWWVAGLMMCLVGITVLLSFVIEYPDTVDGEISVTGQIAPVRLVANAGGRLHLLRKKGQHVRKGDVIGFIENGADYNCLGHIEDLLKSDSNRPSFRSELELGELGPSYNAYVLAWNTWDRLRSSGRFRNERGNLASQLRGARHEDHALQASLKMKKRERDIVADQLRKDSILLAKGLISELEYHSRENEYYAVSEAYLALLASQRNAEAMVEGGKLSIDRSHLEEKEAIDQAAKKMVSKRNILLNDLRLWKEKYYFIAPTDGELDFLGFWRENSVVVSGMELFCIIPKRNKVHGEVAIASDGAGKVRSGQKVNVKLSDFPYDEYGMLVARVIGVSKLTAQKKTSDGNLIGVYLVQVDFPDGLTTNFGKKLSLNFESKGSAEILTRPRRLIERLFDNLKAKGTK